MTLTAALTRRVDPTLDRFVVPGYTRVGPALRRAWWPDDRAPDALSGAVVAVTGANSGLGKASVLGAARLGAEVLILCRDLGRGKRPARTSSARFPLRPCRPSATWAT